MSGFQIPGLGHAQPNEKLPPLPPGQTVDASTTEVNEPSKDVDITDAPEATVEQATQEKQTENTTNGDSMVVDQSATATKQEPVQPITPADSMAVDQPESPPDLTGALEAHLGGLTGEDAEQVLAQASGTMFSVSQNGEQQNPQADNPEWEADSSPYESSSESSSSDSSSDEDSDNEGYELLGVEETARLLMEAEGGSDDEGDKGGKAAGGAHLRTKNEMPEEVIPRPDVTITPEMKVEELGSVEHIVENMMLIKAITPGEYQVLDTGSVLCNADRVVIGAVAETIGKVLQPMYTVMFNSEDEIKELGLEVGTKIYYPADHASYVFTEPLKNLKGTDASNIHDEEVGEDEMEFSDDEKEAEYKRALKDKKRKKGAGSGRGGRDSHPARQEMGPSGELNYDDDDGPYKPLTRPPGFGAGPVSQETYEPPSRSFRGRGRGDSRGRGNRGRGSGRGGHGGSRPGDGYSLPPQGAPAYNQPHQQQQQPPPPPNWNPSAQGSAPAMPNFGFQLPGWPQQPPAQNGHAAPPPPPPGWPAQGQGQAQGANNNMMLNPALLAALMSHMQGQQGGQQQQQWGGQQAPPGGHGQ